MKLKTRALSVLAAAALAMATLAGCTSAAAQAPSDSSAPSATPAPGGQSTGGQVYSIGIIQSMEHAALDAAHEGFVAALAENGYVDGDNLSLDYQNAQGDASNLSTIADRFVSGEKDLVLAITTDAAQSMAGKTTQIPILATAVTSYTTAGLVDSEDAPGGNVSGTSDMNPVAAQIQLAHELAPQAKTIGLIYNSSEDNSVLQARLAAEEIEALGLAVAEMTVTGVNDVQQAMQSLVGKCEAIYIPTDNTLASAMATVHGVAGPAGIPVVAGESNMVLQGGLATMGIDYYALGYKTGLMALEVMDGADISTMSIQYADSSDEVTINGLVARELGYEVPKKYKDCVVEPEAQ